MVSLSADPEAGAKTVSFNRKTGNEGFSSTNDTQHSDEENTLDQSEELMEHHDDAKGLHNETLQIGEGHNDSQSTRGSSRDKQDDKEAERDEDNSQQRRRLLNITVNSIPGVTAKVQVHLFIAQD